MSKIDPVATFRTGCAGTRQVIALSGSMDAFASDDPYSRLYMFNERATHPWTFNEHLFVVPAMCVWQSPSRPGTRFFAALNENGQLVVLGKQTLYEDIADAGLGRPGAAGYGYLIGLKQIGACLYTCGFAGQVLRREDSGGWHHIDQGLLQPVGTGQGGYVVQVVDGSAENDVYIAGAIQERGLPPRADYFDGQDWRRLNLPVGTSRLTCILVESANRVWMGGDNGTLLLGNAATGFRSFGPLGERKLITSVSIFGDKGYVATNAGLFSFDLSNPGGRFVKVRTGLQPEIADANVLHAIDGVLWSFGTKDLARFDGTRWERFHHPDNPPIMLSAASVP